MNHRLAIDPRIGAAFDRVRAAGLSSRLLAGAGLLLVVGVVAMTAPPTMTPDASPVGAASDPGTGAGLVADPSGGPALLGQGSGTELPSLLDLVGKGILVLALLLITLHVLRRFSSAGNPATARMTILESRPLAQRATLHLVAIGDRRLVLGLTQSGLVSLAELTADELPDEVAAADRSPKLPGADLLGARPAELFARIIADLGGRRTSAR